ncbi:ABC transporter ATP-binding protein [Desulfocurvibacter africanus]|uniref:Taurine-transporting ATPase n=2 Tax=Desulfocurvibacter africanus TaxID=873 RepID=F3Z0S4_DESAF|nr:ABC transporter ATP-binding protein [Desulfocurvibacter africanus]EGJ49898.1 Taurine-transporting ATPase [Desulfocurvibacter africanus subsp. africanus str. Walvis Bay]
MLEARRLGKRFSGGREILRDVSLRLGQGESLAVLGPSGCGKTTLLYMLCGLSRPDVGEVLLDGKPVRKGTGDAAIILQDFGLLPWKSVLDNVALGLKIAGIGRAERNERARAGLVEVGLTGRERDWPACLSGGEQQRVAIARAFVMSPRALLLDEPFSSLDAITREKLQATLLAMWRRRGVPYVLVTHSVEEAVYLGGRILLLAGDPAGVADSFDNPGFGSEGYRNSEEYYGLVRQVRAAMEELF